MFNRLWFCVTQTPTRPLLNPDTGGTTGTTPSPSTPAPSTPTPSAPPVSAAQPSPSSPSTSAATVSHDTAAGLGGTPTAPNYRQWISQATGLDFTPYADDDSAGQAIRGIFEQARQWRNQAAQFQEQVVPNWSQFQEFLKTRQQPQPQAQPTQKQDWWGAPEYDPRWEQAIEPDGQGGVRVKQGYPADILHKRTQYQQWQREQVQKLLQNPIETLKPGIEQLVQPLIQQAIQQSFDSHQRNQVGHQILAKNQSWIWSQTPNPITGQQEMTPAGKMYTGFIQQLANQGMKDLALADDIATRMVKASLLEDYYNKQLSGQTQPQPQQGLPAQTQQPAGILPNGTPGPVNRIQQYSGNGVQNTDRTQQTNGPTSFKDLMMAEMRAAGMTDQMLAAQMNKHQGG